MTINTNEYINNLAFQYCETYSFLRGVEHDKKVELYYLLRSKVRSENEEIEFTSLRDELWLPSFIINREGHIQPLAIKTNTFSYSDSKTQLLIRILQNPVVEKMDWMCAPYYRDAVIFYDKNGKIISTLNVCLSCEKMQIENKEYVEADTKTYFQLKQFFIDCGHNVEK